MNSWIAKPLADVCERITDGSHRTPPFTEAGYPFATVAHVDADGQIDLASCKRISSSNFEELKRNDCRPLPGDVLFSKDGTVGKVAVIDFDADFIVLSSLAILRPKQEVLNQRFLAYALRSEAVLGEAINRKSGSAIRRIVLRDLRQVSIPIPPLVEQERIVKLLDEADELRKLRVQADHRTDALIPSLFHEIFGDLGSINWKEHSFDEPEIIEIIDGDRGSNYPKKTDFREEGYCLFLNTSNVRNGTFEFSKCDFITREKDAELRKGKLSRGDVILTTRGTLGNSAYYGRGVPHENVRINSGMVILRANTTLLLPEYLLVILSSDGFVNQVSAMTSGSAQPQLPINKLSKIKFVLPPLPLQKEFAARVSEIRAVQAEQATSRRRLDDLFQSLLHRAFKGEL